MRIPFTKAHGAGNDFLLTWLNEAPRANQAETAIAMCERHTGIGADGWLLVGHPAVGEKEFDGSIIPCHLQLNCLSRSIIRYNAFRGLPDEQQETC